MSSVRISATSSLKSSATDNMSITDKVRLLYDRGLPTARIIVRSRRDLQTPLASALILPVKELTYTIAGYDPLLSSCYEPHTH